MRRSFQRPTKNMASTLFVLLAIIFFAGVIAAPLDKPGSVQETTTASDSDGDVALVDIVEIVEVPVVIPIGYEATTEAETVAPKQHKVVKRSALRGDNPSNDLLVDFENLKLDSGLSSFDGRRIKFLPTWVGK